MELLWLPYRYTGSGDDTSITVSVGPIHDTLCPSIGSILQHRVV